MTVAPLIAMKSTKCESLEAVGKELDRRAHTYANDVDQSGRHVGYLCRAGDESPVPLEQAIERRMGELNTKRKIRDNQVRAMGFIVSTNEALPDEETAKEFLNRSVRGRGQRSGWTAWAGNCGPHQKARAEKCADDHKGAQTRSGGLGARLRGRR